MGEIVSLESVFEIWKSLTCSYDSNTNVRIMALKAQLQKIKKVGSSVSQYLANQGNHR